MERSVNKEKRKDPPSRAHQSEVVIESSSSSTHRSNGKTVATVKPRITKSKSTQVGDNWKSACPEDAYEGADEAGPEPFPMPKHSMKNGYDGDDERRFPDYLALGDQVSVQLDPLHVYVYEARRDIPPEFLPQLRLTRIRRLSLNERDHRLSQFSERETEALDRHRARLINARKKPDDPIPKSGRLSTRLPSTPVPSDPDLQARRRQSYLPPKFRRRRRKRKKEPTESGDEGQDAVAGLLDRSESDISVEQKASDISDIKPQTPANSASSTSYSSVSESVEGDLSEQSLSVHSSSKSVTQESNKRKSSLQSLFKPNSTRKRSNIVSVSETLDRTPLNSSVLEESNDLNQKPLLARRLSRLTAKDSHKLRDSASPPPPSAVPSLIIAEEFNKLLIENTTASSVLDVHKGLGNKDYIKIRRAQRKRQIELDKVSSIQMGSRTSNASTKRSDKEAVIPKASTWSKGPVPAARRNIIPYTFETGPGALRFFNEIRMLMVRHEVLSYSSNSKVKQKFDLLDENGHRVMKLHKVRGGFFGQRTELLGLDFYNERWSLKFSFHGPGLLYKRKVVIFAPTSEIGIVEQTWNPRPVFEIKDRTRQVIARIRRVKDVGLGQLNGAFIIFNDIDVPIGDIRDNCSDLAKYPHLFGSQRSFGIHFYDNKDIWFNLKAKLLAATMLIYKIYFDGKVQKKVMNDPSDAQWREFWSESNAMSQDNSTSTVWEYPEYPKNASRDINKNKPTDFTEFLKKCSSTRCEVDEETSSSPSIRMTGSVHKEPQQ